MHEWYKLIPFKAAKRNLARGTTVEATSCLSKENYFILQVFPASLAID